MKFGNFDKLAENYAKYRPTYNFLLIKKIIKQFKKKTIALELGAGTGKFTKILQKLNYFNKIIAIEPSKQMMEQGINLLGNKKITWKNTKAENIKMKNDSVDLICAASSFHWFNNKKCLLKISKILKNNCYFIIIYNSRKTSLSKDEKRIDYLLKKKYKIKKRISSGRLFTKKKLENDLGKTNFNIVNKECQIDLRNIKKENYIGAWKSVNDIQVQLGSKFIKFINDIEKLLSKNRTVKVYYETKVWVLKNVKS